MKPQTVFLGHMTNPEVERYLKKGSTVIVPVGSTEQHGPAGPTATDVLIPVEIASRVAAELGALVAPPVSYGLSYPHRGFTSVFDLSIETFMAVIQDLCLAFGRAGFKRIIFLNGHFDNTYAIAFGCARAAEKLPRDCRAYPLSYWEGLPAEVAGRFSGGEHGLHAGKAEISAVLAIDPRLVDMEAANRELPNLPRPDSPAVHTAFFLTAPGTVWQITKSGTWGDATAATEELGREYLEHAARATIALVRDVEKTLAEAPRR